MLKILAPMDDVTDTVFRRMVYDCAPFDLSMTEFTNVDGLCSAGRGNIIRKLGTEQDAGPVIAHIWGKRPENFEAIAYEIAQGLLGDSVYEAWLEDDRAENPEDSQYLRAQRYLNTHTHERRSSFVGIDLNFGCPAKAEVKAECCSAMQQLHLRPNAEAIIESTLKGAGDMPVSFKTRLGFREIDYTWHAFLLRFKPSMLTVPVSYTHLTLPTNLSV